MNEISTSIWLYEPLRIAMTSKGLRQFVFRRTPKRKVLVVRAGDFPEKYKRALGFYQRLGLLEIIHIEKAMTHYKSEDFDVTLEAQRIASHLSARIVTPLLAQSNLSLSARDIENIAAGFQLRLVDQLYAKLRLLLIVLRKSDVPVEGIWEDYNRWAFRMVGLGDQWWMWPQDGQARTVTLISKSKPFEMGLPPGTGFKDLPDSPPVSLFFSIGARPAYLKSTDMICQAERRMGNEVRAIFPMGAATSLAPPQIAQSTAQRLTSFHLDITSLLPGPAGVRTFTKLTTKACQPEDFEYATLRCDDPELASNLLIHPEMWLAFLASESALAVNGALGRIVGFYLGIMQDPRYDRVQTAIFSPSRTEFFAPVALALKQRGVHTIEYQPLFWSDHPRYVVRDMDLFICSDRATMKVIERKYAESGSQAKILLGPFFSMDQFIKDYFETLEARQTREESNLVGIALQPENLEEAKEACTRLVNAGKQLLIRPHPAQTVPETLPHIEQMFSPFGVMDTGDLNDFIARSSAIVTGFSNVALQAATVGKIAICLPVPNAIGLDLADASSRILICETMEDLIRFVDQSADFGEAPAPQDALDHWCEIRRTQGDHLPARAAR